MTSPRGILASPFQCDEDIRAYLKERRDIDAKTGCWLWNKVKDKNGYGLVKIRGKQRRVPRVSLEVFKGETLTSSDQALHSCDTPSCFNPDHLRKGSSRENRADAFARGRITGEKMSSWFAKRTERVLAKPNCKNGHPRTVKSTMVKVDGRRECRICNMLRARERRREGKT